MMPINHALVTAGGTREPVDDVRYVGNLSSGRFGAEIAAALVSRNIQTTLLGSRELLRHPDKLDPRLELVSFSSFTDLDRELTRLIAHHPPDLLMMVAAVSDYSPIRAPGKIRSTDDELVIRMTRNPKILATLRDRCGKQTTLVGFKLLSGVTAKELIGAARDQIEACDTDLVVANDLQQLGGDRHPVTLVPTEGEPQTLDGCKREVAEQLIDWILENPLGYA